MSLDVLASPSTMVCGLMMVFMIFDVVSGLTASSSSMQLAVNTLLCPVACQCTVVPGSERRIAADCDRPINHDERFDPQTEVVHVTGNCHRSLVSVMASVGSLAAPRELSLRRCHLYSVEQLTSAGDAVNWDTVFDLDVGFNLITRVIDRAFVKMSSLRTLVMRHNRIETIQQSAFDGLNELVKLDLTGNRLSMLTPIDMRWICSLRSLDELSLRDNGVHVLAAAAFHCRSKPCPLQRLDLGENRIRRVEDDAFIGLSNVTRLNLDSSQLTVVPTRALVRLSTSLEELDMSGNQLDALLTHSFHDLSALRVLRLSRILTLQFVDRNCFDNMSSLERVELSGNSALKYVDREAFINVPNIADISLAGCRLFAVDRQLVDTLTSLKSLDLRLNPISCDCHTKWMRLSNIITVDVDVWKQCKDNDTNGTGCSPQIAALFNSELDVQLTDTFTLHCHAVGSPSPLITWRLPSSLDNNSSAEVQYCFITVFNTFLPFVGLLT